MDEHLLDGVCPNCKSEFDDIGLLYCGYCGTKLISMNDRINDVIRLVDEVHGNLLSSPVWQQSHKNDILQLEKAVKILLELRG